MSENKLIKKKWPWITAFSLVLVVALVLTSVFVLKPWDPNSPLSATEPETNPLDSVLPGLTMEASSKDLYCLEFTSYSGAFYEDGSNEQVENIAAILVENRSEEFLEKATITYDVGDDTATFVATAIPAGAKCWVLEQNRMKMSADLKFEFVDCVSGFKQGTSLNEDVMLVETEDDVITVTNKSEDTMYSVVLQKHPRRR